MLDDYLTQELLRICDTKRIKIELDQFALALQLWTTVYKQVFLAPSYPPSLGDFELRFLPNLGGRGAKYSIRNDIVDG